MAKINRYDGDVKAFASESIGTERTVFGDVTQSDELTDNITADFLRGWGIVPPSGNPTKQDFNALAFTITQMLSYVHQMGIPEWNSGQEYETDSVVVHVNTLFISLSDANIGNDPVSDTVNWRNLFDPVFSGNATFYTDSGVADAYILTKIGNNKYPDAHVDGLRASFRAANKNTGASTAKIGSLPTKNIKLSDGSNPVAGDMNGLIDLVYDSANGYFILINPKVTGALEKYESVSALMNSLPESDVVDTLSYYTGWAVANEAPKGRTTWYRDGSTGTASTIDIPNTVLYDAGGKGWKMLLESGFINVLQGGLKMDGSNEFSILQDIHDTGYHVIYVPGTIVCDTATAIQLQPGQIVKAPSGDRFEADYAKRSVKITNSIAGGGIFAYTGDTDITEKAAPQIIGFDLQADYPIELNDRTADVSDGGPQPYMKKPWIIDNYIHPRVEGTGYGLQMTKCFDGIVTGNEIVKFEHNLILCGSDLNSVRDNRITEGTATNILEFAVGTFGSQNEIQHNDLLAVGTSAVHFRSNSRHIRFYDNYMENTTALVGFVDLSATDMPNIFGGKTPAVSFSVDCIHNRIDGHDQATAYVHRLNPTAVMNRIIDDGTTGTPFGSGEDRSLTIEGGYLPSRYNIFHRPYYEFKSPAFGKWRNYCSSESLARSNKNLVVTSESFGGLDNDVVNQANAGDYTFLDADAIVFDVTMPVGTFGHWYPPAPGVDGNNNENFVNGVNYTVTVTAKTDSGSGDTLRIARILNGAGGTTTDWVLTEQFQAFTFTMAGALLTDTVGIYLKRQTSNGNIKIRSVEWEPV